MTQLCAAISVRDPATARRDIALAAEAGAEMVELRIDTFTDPAQVRELIAASTIPVILTCRAEWEGGECELPDERRLEVLTEAAGESASYIDFELKASANIHRAPRDSGPRLIVSSHDFSGRPDRLYNILRELEQSGGDVIKIVWAARTIRDNLEIFEILRHRTRPTIALCMGEAGLISRVLAKKFGGFVSFAGVRRQEITAPGQVSVDEMKRLYRWDSVRPATKVYGVVGHPVAHSMSPAIHNAAFDKTKHDGVYLPLLVNPGYESFKAFMESFLGFEPLDLSGLSVTIPHKENALRYLTEKHAEVDPLAVQIGAVNTVLIDRSAGRPRLRGLNTDYGAILDSITSKLGITREKLADFRVAVIGAGGTARSAVAALAHYGATVVVHNRTRERAEALAAEFNGKTGKVVAAPLEKLCDSCCQTYLNTTSIGMHPNVDASPWGERPPKLAPSVLVFDSVYNPIRTKFISQAEAAGAQTITGVEMFVRQAVAQFEAWTGVRAPVDVMRQVVEQRLGAGED